MPSQCGCSHTAAPEAVEQLGKDATMRAPIGVGHQNVHVPTAGLAAAIGAAGHAHQPRIQGLGRLPHLQRERHTREE